MLVGHSFLALGGEEQEGVRHPTVQPEEVRVLLASSAVSCEDNKVKEKKSDRDCDIILNYNHKNFKVFLIKLYKRGTSDSDINDMSKNPVKYKEYNKQINYMNKVKLLSGEELSGLSARFARTEGQKDELTVVLNVEVSKYRERTADDVVVTDPEDEGEAPVAEELNSKIKTGRRTIELKFPVSEL